MAATIPRHNGTITPIRKPVLDYPTPVSASSASKSRTKHHSFIQFNPIYSTKIARAHAQCFNNDLSTSLPTTPHWYILLLIVQSNTITIKCIRICPGTTPETPSAGREYSPGAARAGVLICASCAFAGSVGCAV